MAEFCVQCAKKFGFTEDDFKGLTTKEVWDEGKAAVVLCEECGPIQVDPDGRCVVDCRLHHGIKEALTEFLTTHLVSRNFVQLIDPSGEIPTWTSLTVRSEIEKGLELYEQVYKKGDANDKEER